jgi:hypothetical protein
MKFEDIPSENVIQEIIEDSSNSSLASNDLKDGENTWLDI